MLERSEEDEAPLGRETGAIIAACIGVHQELGPGLLEAVYQDCLVRELGERGHRVQQEVKIPITYKGKPIGRWHRLDLLVDDLIVVETKAIEETATVHKAQLLTYLRMAGKRVGLLVNFNVPKLVDGVHRVVNPDAGPAPPPRIDP